MPKDRPMAVALTVSALFHLSMVTVFSIGVWFDIDPVSYYKFEIKAQTPGSSATAPTTSSPRHLLQVPAFDAMTEPSLPSLDSNGTLSITAPTARIPEVELPTLFAADMARLQMTRRSLEIRTQQSGFFRDSREDSWARFGDEVLQLRKALSRLPLFAEDESNTPERMQRVSVPAPGYAIYIEWLSGPADRELLFSPPIQALWNLDASALAEPISFVFRVGPDGKVREVMDASSAYDPDLLASVSRALVNYRFTPLPSGNTEDQTGTLILAQENDTIEPTGTPGVLTVP